MMAVQVRQKLADVDRRIATLKPWQETLTKARQRYLLGGDNHSREVVAVIEHGVRSGEGRPADPELEGFDLGLPGLLACEGEMARLRERRALLEGELPSDEQVAEADKEARELAKRAGQASARFAASWAAFVEALTVAEAAGRQVVEVRAEGQRASATANDLAAQFGLDVDVPKVPEPPRDEAELAGLISSLLRTIGYEQSIDTTADRDLQGAKRRAEKAAA